MSHATNGQFVYERLCATTGCGNRAADADPYCVPCQLTGRAPEIVGRSWQWSNTGSLPPDQPRDRPREIDYLTDVVCLHCGQLVCKVSIEHPRAAVRIPRDVRCDRCGGPVVATGEVERVSRYSQHDSEECAA